MFLKLFIFQFRYATRKDIFWMTIGVLSSMTTGALQPLNTLLFGNLTGSIVDYVSTIMDPDTSDIMKEEASDVFIGKITDFAVYNSLIGAGMLVFSYISTETFNYAAIKQVKAKKQTFFYQNQLKPLIFQIFKVRSLYFEKVLNQDISWYDVNNTGDFASRMSE